MSARRVVVLILFRLAVTYGVIGRARVRFRILRRLVVVDADPLVHLVLGLIVIRTVGLLWSRCHGIAVPISRVAQPSTTTSRG